MNGLLKRIAKAKALFAPNKPEPLAVWSDRHSLAQFYPSRNEIEAAWDAGKAPALGMCHPCGAVRPLEIDGSCSGCGAVCILAPRFWQKVDGRWIQRDTPDIVED